MDGFYLLAFKELSSCRQIGMGVGPIPWDKVILYAERVGLDDDMENAFLLIIRQMDAVFLEWQAEEANRKERMKK